MKCFKVFFLLFLLSVFSACINHNRYPMDKSFESFKEEFISELWKLNPLWALQSGYHLYDDVIEIPSQESMEKKIKRYAEITDSLKKYDWKKLSPANQIDIRMIGDYLDYYKWSVERFKSWKWNPAEYNVGEGFDLVMSNRNESLDKRLLTVTERLKYVPAYYITAKGNIKRPTPEHTQLAIEQNTGALEIFEINIPDSLKVSTLTDSEKQLLNERLANAIVAIKDYVAFLTTMQSEWKKDSSLVSSFRIGKALYDKKFNYELQSSYTAEQIYEKALQHKTDLHKQMTGLTSQLWKKYFGNSPIPEGLAAVQQMIDTLSSNHCNRDSFLYTIKNQIRELESFVKKKNLLYLDPTKPIVVRETPAYMEGSGAGASISAPGPYDVEGNTYYNVTPLTKYSNEEAESYLREYNNYTLQILNMHEAIPGHYVQLVYANKTKDLIKSIFQNGAMVEGWAVYCEKMMLEEGYDDESPEMWLMYCKWNLRSTLNTILDYSIQCLNMSEQDAMNLMMNEGFQTEAEAKGKWHRATLSQVQLCSYFTGFTEIYNFRNEYKQKAGEQYTLKGFNEKFLSYGSAPVKYIRELMLKELEQ